LVALADDDIDGDVARARLRRATDLAAPALLDFEVLSVLRRQLLYRTLDPRRAELALTDVMTFPIDRYDDIDLVPRIWAPREALTPYDAAYVALAELIECPLVTADARLAKGAAHAGSPVSVEVLG
jgi:predicted nucleic acid-binding protein